jgi:AcrR family transcriptional regulator
MADAGFEPEDEALSGEEGRGRVTRLLAEELGEEWAARIDAIWTRIDEWDRRHNISEGLRERKKRQTRQRISDAATAMFLARGFDNVKISEIAGRVGVSDKTIYNYFPTKESLVYDQADEQLMRLAAAIRERSQGSSPTSAFIAALKADTSRFHAALGDTRLDDARMDFLVRFAEMIRGTPTLRSAWGEHRHKMVETLTAILAQEAGIDPRDPEPISVARALVSLLELMFDSQMRHLADGVKAEDLQAAVEADLDRAARLLDTGLWSFVLMVEGRKTKDQLRDAAVAAEQARQQVLRALRDAKQAFREIRGEARAAGREMREETRATAQRHREQARALKGRSPGSL